MKFQTLVTLTVMTLLVTPSSADGFHCPSCRIDSDSGHCSGCRVVSGRLSNFPPLLRFLSLEGDDASVETAWLDEKVFAEFTELDSLSLSRMIISEIGPCTLCHSPLLTSVALDNVTVERLPPDLLANSSELQEFSAAGCGLTDVPDELFAGNAYLRMVNLSGNALTSVPRGLFLGRTTLRTVDLSDNALTYLPSGIFATNGNLRKVSLAGNRLTELPLWSFDRNPQLSVFSLDEESLNWLVEGFLGIGQPYPTLSLEGNPLSCGCRLHSDVTQLETKLRWAVSLPEGCDEEMVRADCPTPFHSSSSSSPVLVTWSLYLGVVGWTIWQVAKGLLDR